MRILIVEDNLLSREMYKDMLLVLGHEAVAEADSLDDTLAAYRRHRPDAVTLDLSLPKEDGLAVLRALRGLDPEARVVVVSGNCQQRIREEVLKAGAVDLLAKPIDIAALKRSLERAADHGHIAPRPEGHPPAH